MAIRIDTHILQKHILPDEQFGFRQNHSTTHALLNTINGIRSSIMDGKTEVLVNLDIEKAFDTVWIKGLLHKTIMFEFPKYIIKLLHSYLSNRRFNVVVGESNSVTHTMSNGLPEGSVSGPILFTIFISDIPKLSFPNLSMLQMTQM